MSVEGGKVEYRFKDQFGPRDQPASSSENWGGEHQVAIPAPASAADAMDMVRIGLSYLAAVDPAAMAGQAQAECLQALEQSDAILVAARARILAAFTAGQAYSADADYSPTSWLIHRTRITKGAARGHLRLELRKRVAGTIDPPYGRSACATPGEGTGLCAPRCTRRRPREASIDPRKTRIEFRPS
jgi:hypothetical protein